MDQKIYTETSNIQHREKYVSANSDSRAEETKKVENTAKTIQ